MTQLHTFQGELYMWGDGSSGQLGGVRGVRGSADSASDHSTKDTDTSTLLPSLALSSTLPLLLVKAGLGEILPPIRDVALGSK